MCLLIRVLIRHIFQDASASGRVRVYPTIRRVISPFLQPRDDTNWMIQYRGNVIGNEIGRPSRFVTCNFSTRVPRADNEGKNIAAAFDERRDIFVSLADNVKLCIRNISWSFFCKDHGGHDQHFFAARELIIFMNRYGYAFILISDIKKFFLAFS